jgi:hypothetical protein
MQSTNLREIKAALWEQAFIGCTRVACPMGRVVRIRRRKGQLQAQIFGWGRWYDVACVSIEVLFIRSDASSRNGVINKQGVIGPSVYF